MATVDIALVNIVKEFYEQRSDRVVRAVDDVTLDIYDGEFFALLGPSGCGKTTTLRMIAGFEDPSAGKIVLRGKEVQGVPPFHRPVNTVFQDYALFPHMTILQNVMFGLRMDGVSQAESSRRAHEMLELVQLPNVANRKPGQLSGGQQQRVALARALIKRPAVLLLDEPLGALDLKLRKAMQFELKSMQQQIGITFIYVTHDQEEAMAMADRIAVMSHGKVLQIGKPEEIYERPADRFVADFIGETNFIDGQLVEHAGNRGRVKFDEHTTITAQLSDENIPLNSEVTVAIRPEKLSLNPTEGQIKRGEGYIVSADEFRKLLEDEPDNTFVEGEIINALYIGTDTRYIVRIGDNTEIAARIQNFSHRYDTIYKAGQKVYVFWDIENARILSH